MRVNKLFSALNMFSEFSIYRVAILTSLLILSGCVSLPPGTGLNSPTNTKSLLNQKAWIGTVKLTDYSTENKSIVEDSLRGNITAYIQQTGYFTETNTLPGKTGNNDWILDFQFDQYQQNRSMHPAYFPLAIATATLYIWFGGPIVVDSSELSGTLTVKNSTGQTLLKTSSNVHEEHNVNFWSPDYILYDGNKPRTTLMDDLMSKVYTGIHSKINP